VTSASRFRPRLAFDFAVARPHLSFGLHTAAANVADFLGKSSPALIIGAFLGVKAVGHYAMASQIIRIPDALVSGPVYLALFAAISSRAQELEAASLLTMRALRGIAVGIAPMFFGLAVVADLAVKLCLGHKWLGSIEVLILLTPAGFLICLYSIVVAALLGLGRSAEQFHLTVLTGLFMNAGVFLGARFGAAGAAAGLSAGGLLITPAYIWTLARGLKVPARALAGEASAPIGASLVMAATVLILRQAIGGWQEGAQLVVSILVGAAAFAAALALLCRRRLLDDVREILPPRARQSPRVRPSSARG
jgi:PST family polysaccharide transporter